MTGYERAEAADKENYNAPGAMGSGDTAGDREKAAERESDSGVNIHDNANREAPTLEKNADRGDGGVAAPAPTTPKAPENPAATPAPYTAAAPVDPMGKAQELALAQQAGAVNSSVGAGRAAGLSPAQAALMGSGAGSSTYQQSLGSDYLGLNQQGLQKYGMDVNKELGLKGLATTERGQDINAKIAAEQARQSQAQSTMGGMLGIFQGSASFLPWLLASDVNAKTDIHDGYGMLEKVVREVAPKVYKYKGDDTPRAGVMAQDLERTPLAHTVVDTPQGKMVDTRQLTTANTAMISELSRKLDDSMKYIKSRSAR